MCCALAVSDDGGHYGHHSQEEPLPADIWDDVEVSVNGRGGGKGLDLAEFSAASLRFSEMGYRGAGGAGGELYSQEGDLTMAALMRDQDQREAALMGALEGDEGSAQPAVHKGGPSNEKGRSLLLQTLSVKAAPASGGGGGKGIVASNEPPGSALGGSAAEVPRRAHVQISSDDTLLDALIEDDAIFGPSQSAQSGPVGPADGEEEEGLALDLAGSVLMDDSLLETTIRAPALPVAPVSPNLPLQPRHAQQQVRPAPVPEVVSAPPAPAYVEGWLYQDPNRNMQGPFETSAMRRWLESGYFKEHLPIKMPHWGAFHPLGVVFPNPEVAFLGRTSEPGAGGAGGASSPARPPQPAPILPERVLPQSVTVSDESVPAGKRASAPSAPSPQQQQTGSAQATARAPEPAAVAAVGNKQEGGGPGESASGEGSTSLGGGSRGKDKGKEKEKEKESKKQKQAKRAKGDASSAKEESPQPSVEQPASAWGGQQTGQGGKGKGKKAPSLTEIQQQQEEAVGAKESRGATAKSFQLKNLLGVGTGGGIPSAGSNAWAAGSSTASQSTTSLKDIQQEQQTQSKKKKAQQLQQQQQEQQQLVPPRGSSGAGSSQWKAPAVSGADKSLKEIMEEEQAAAQAGAQAAATSGSSEAPSARPAPGSWAARAGGPRATESGVPANWTTPAPALPPVPPPAPSVPEAAAFTPVVSGKPSKTKAAPAAGGVVATVPPQQASRRKGTGSPRKHSELVEWSEAQVKTLSGDKKSSTEDVALIEFCLTLSSAADIREYFAHYLGSTPQVSSAFLLS